MPERIFTGGVAIILSWAMLLCGLWPVSWASLGHAPQQFAGMEAEHCEQQLHGVHNMQRPMVSGSRLRRALHRDVAHVQSETLCCTAVEERLQQALVCIWSATLLDQD